MATRNPAGICRGLLYSFGVAMVIVGSAGAATDAPKAAAGFTTLHAFKSGSDGEGPLGGLVADNEGNIYGTTYYGGGCIYCGLVFMLKRPATDGGEWSYNVIYEFPPDSGSPTGALTIKDGVIYGTAATEVFRLRPLNNKKTRWKHTTLHHFSPLKQLTPGAGVVFGRDGALYGSTTKGGKHNSGIAFRLSGSGDQQWSYELLYEFERTKHDDPSGGVGPEGEFLIDPKANVIYGTTYSGGHYGQGTIFELKQSAGSWEHTVLHDFAGVYNYPKKDGSQPRGRLVFGADGAIYGTTELGDKGGSWNQGTIYRLNKQKGQWSYSILHEFMGGDKDGSEPKSGLTLDDAGNLIGTTSGGGPAPYQGVVYQFSQLSGKWKLALLYSFKGGKDGAAPWSQPILSKGALYGTAIMGGVVKLCNHLGCGTVYRIEH